MVTPATEPALDGAYAVLLEDGQIASAGESPALAESYEDAEELKEWIAFDFMGWDSADSLDIKQIELTEP